MCTHRFQVHSRILRRAESRVWDPYSPLSVDGMDCPVKMVSCLQVASNDWSHLTNHRAVLQSRDNEMTNQRAARSSSSLSRNNSRNSGLTSAKSSLNQNIINNNNLRVKTTRDSLSSSRPNVSTPSSQHRTRTPSVERSLPSIKETVSSDSRKLKETVSMLKDTDPSKVRSSSRSFWGGWWKF